MGVFGQERAVQVRAVGVVDDAAFAGVLAVVAEAGQHSAERLGTRAQIGATTVVLEADQRRLVPAQGDVANAARDTLAGMDRPGVEDGGALELRPFGGA